MKLITNMNQKALIKKKKENSAIRKEIREMNTEFRHTKLTAD